jgi:Cd2+/Zn2+-exporting ATPase
MSAPEEHSGSKQTAEDDHCDDCDHAHGSSRAESISLIVSGVMVSAGLVAEWTNALPQAGTAALSIAAILAGGWFLLPKAGRAILKLRPDINLLVVIAAIGASVIGEFIEAAAVVFLFGVAEWLEGWADRRARRAVAALLEIAPKVASVNRDGRFVEVPVGEVKAGETVAVKSAMSIPLDGEVVSGESAVNQAPITGESVPVEKKTGDTVFAGTINGEGSLEIRVTKVAGDTTLAKIIRLVKEAQEQKAPAQRFVDVFARYYTPAVTLVALLVFLVPPLTMNGDWSEWLYRACVLLIIACPCALVISTPVSIVAGLTALAKRGVLVKGGAHLESIAKLKALAIDKTGTITEGKPTVQGVETLGQNTEHTCCGLRRPLMPTRLTHLPKRSSPTPIKTAWNIRAPKTIRTAPGAVRRVSLTGIHILPATTVSRTNSAFVQKTWSADSPLSKAVATRSSLSVTGRMMAAKARFSASSPSATPCAQTPRTRSVRCTMPACNRS